MNEDTREKDDYASIYRLYRDFAESVEKLTAVLAKMEGALIK